MHTMLTLITITMGYVHIIGINGETHSCSDSESCANKKIQCANNEPCTITCESQACYGLTVECPLNGACNINCVARQACTNADITCGTGPCSLDSAGGNGFNYAILRGQTSSHVTVTTKDADPLKEAHIYCPDASSNDCDITITPVSWMGSQFDMYSKSGTNVNFICPGNDADCSRNQLPTLHYGNDYGSVQELKKLNEAPGEWGLSVPITNSPTTNAPTDAPTNEPTSAPTDIPADAPTNQPIKDAEETSSNDDQQYIKSQMDQETTDDSTEGECEGAVGWIKCNWMVILIIIIIILLAAAV